MDGEVFLFCRCVEVSVKIVLVVPPGQWEMWGWSRRLSVPCGKVWLSCCVCIFRPLSSLELSGVLWRLISPAWGYLPCLHYVPTGGGGGESDLKCALNPGFLVWCLPRNHDKWQTLVLWSYSLYKTKLYAVSCGLVPTECQHCYHSARVTFLNL